MLPDFGGQNDPSFVSGSLFGGATQDSFSIRSGRRGEFGSQVILQLPFAKGFQGTNPILTFAPGVSAALLSFEGDPFGPPTEPTGFLSIISGSANLISGPTFSDIDFTFDETVATLESPPTLVEREAGLSVEDLSYSLKAPTTDLQEFSWNATSNISVSWAEPSFARIFGSTTLSLEDSLEETDNEVVFFVKGFLGDESNPFEVFTENLSLKPGMSQLVNWDLTKIASLLPGDYTLGLTSGVRWQPGASDSVLTVSSQYGADVAPIPTPALLPGLVGMGVAALRRKRKGEAA